jgi:uncharacterized protein YegP (UPF0339 family)
MGLFGFGKKKKKRLEEERRLEEQKRIEEENRLAEQRKQEELAKKAKLEEAKARQEELAAKKQVEEKKQVIAEKIKEKKDEVPKVQKSKPVTNAKNPKGKYEVYPEAGLFKYRLKASNGEILVVSFGYSTRKGAKTGIETFKNAVETGNFEIHTDKAGFSHFDLFGARGARVIAIGEFYKTLKLAESAVESVKNFASTDKVIDLEEIPSAEIREEIVEVPDIEENPKGKYQLVKEGKSYVIKLLASNSQVLLVSQLYASKQTALNGLEAIKKAIEARNFTIYKDKQNRYQYNLYTANKQLIVSGETYPVKKNCLSSVQSVCRFGLQAELVEVK